MGLTKSLTNLTQRNIDSSTNPTQWGIWVKPGNFLGGVGEGVDHTRATIFEWPIIWFSVAFLYHRGWVRPNDDISFGLGDFLLVTVVSYLIKRMAVGQRWRSM